MMQAGLHRCTVSTMCLVLCFTNCYTGSIAMRLDLENISHHTLDHCWNIVPDGTSVPGSRPGKALPVPAGLMAAYPAGSQQRSLHA